MAQYKDIDNILKTLPDDLPYKASVKRVLIQAPTEDVIEVVRCKNCKHRYVPIRCALWYGTANGTEYFAERGEDFYCGFGEMKGETK